MSCYLRSKSLKLTVKIFDHLKVELVECRQKLRDGADALVRHVDAVVNGQRDETRMKTRPKSLKKRSHTKYAQIWINHEGFVHKLRQDIRREIAVQVSTILRP